MIEIRRMIGGKETVVCTVPDDNASVVSEIMGREEVNASVTVDSPLDIRVDDYVRVDGVVYTLNREAGFGKRSDVEYRYDLVFESPLYRLLDKLFTHPVTGVSTFTVSRTLKEFVKIVVDCVNTIDPGWTVSAGIPDTDPVNLTFEGISCREALTRFSDGFGMDFYLSGREVCLVRDMENATGLVFEQGKGKGLYTVTQEPVDTGDAVTRVYPYGGTTNVFPADGDVNGRLYLPEGYLEDLTGYGKVVEREVVFDDIFPCLKASAGSVSGEYNHVITCGDINFDINSYGIGGVAAKINFLSGELMGESFAFTYTHAGKQICLIRKEDRIAEPDSKGKRPLIPHDLKKARAGDRFNLTDIYVPDEYKAGAIVELRARATDYLAYYSRPRVKFTLEVDHRYLRGRRILRAGDTVTVKIPETGMEKPLRVNSVERNLKTGKMSCVVSNYLDERWEKRIEGELTNIRSSVSGDISDIRGEVSNVGRPSSLWYPDKLREYFHLNEDNTISLLGTNLIVEGYIKSKKSITAYASDDSTPTWFDKLPVARYDLKGIVQIKENSGLVVSDGLISIDPKWKGNGKTYYAGAGLKLGTKAGSGETGNEFAVNFGRLAGTVVEGNDSRLSDGQKALDRLAACSWWGQKLPEDGIMTGALSGVTKINSMIHLDVSGTVGLGDKSGSWARLTGNRLDGMTVGGVMSDLYLNYSSPAKNVRIDKDGNLIVSGNIKATGAIVAYASDGSTPSWFDQLPVAGYDLKGILRVDQESPLRITDGLLTLDKSLVGGISGIKPGTGSGNVITSLSLSADGRYITPDKGISAVNKLGDIMTGNLTVPVLISNVPTGTAPFAVSSTTQVANLNAQMLGGVMNGDVTAKYMKVIDTRNDTPVPSDYSSTSGVIFAFKTNTAISLSGTGVGSFSGLMSFKPWGPNSTDTSGGPMHQLAFNPAGIYHRKSVDASTFGTWTRLAYITDNVASATNADMLDNYHATDFTSFSNQPIDLNLVNKYIHSAWSTATANYPAAALGGNTFLILSAMPNSNNTDVYASQLAFGFGSDYLGIRRKAGSATWSAWTRISAGYADSSGKLQNPRTINGTNFDGTANITTNTWGAARNFSIASHDMSGQGIPVSVNGFSSYVLPLPSTIKAALVGNASSASTATKLTNARKIWGQDFDGTAAINGSIYNVNHIYMGNNNDLFLADSSNVNRSALTLSASNDLLIGFGTAMAGYSTNLYAGTSLYYRFNNSGSPTNVLFSFKDTGRLGIGMSNPSVNLDIVTNGQSIIKATTSNTGWTRYLTGINSAANTAMILGSSGVDGHLQYGLESVSDTYRFYIQGVSGTRLLEFRANAKTATFTGDLVVTGNIRAAGGVTAYASDGSTPSWFDQLPVAGYENGPKGVIRAYSGQFTVDSITGLLKIKEGAVGFGNILFTGSGSFLSDVTASADKKTLTFTRVGKPSYNVSEITNAVSTTDSRLSNSRPASDVYAWAKAASKPTYTYSEVGAAQRNQDPAVNLDTVNGIGIMSNPLTANATTVNKYPIAEAGTLFYGAAAYSSANQVYGSFSSNRWFARGGGMSPTTKTAWREFAFLDSVVSKAGDTMSGLLQVNSHIRSKGGNINVGIVGTTGGWERGLMWGNLDFSTTYGSVTMFGNASTPGYISIGFGEYNDGKRAFFYPNGGLTAYTISTAGLTVGAIKIQDNNEINCDAELHIGYRNSNNIITNFGGGSLDARGIIYAKKGVVSVTNNSSMAWGEWQNYNQPFKAASVTVNQGAYYPVLTWSSVMPTGYIQWSSIGSLRAGGFGDVAITVGSADNNSTSAKYLFSYDGTFTSSKIHSSSTLTVGGVITGADGLHLIGMSANSASHIRLVNSSSGCQWGIKAGCYMNNENDFTITSESDSVSPSLLLQRNSSSYGKMKVVSIATSECSIGYVNSNNNASLGNPAWVVGVNTGSATGIFGWYSGAMGSNIMSLTNYDGLYLHRGWLRTSEDTGWYSQKWNGGIYMNDQNWVKIFNKSLMCPYANSFGPSSFNVNLVVGQSSLAHSGMEFTSSNKIFGMGVHSNGNTYFWGGTNSYADGTSGKSYIGTINLVNNQFSWYGSIVSQSTITAYSTNGSDMRRKTVINPRYDLDPRSLLKVWTFTYRWDQDKDDTPLVGMSAQQMLGIAPSFVMGANDEKGDYYTFDYGRFGAIGLVKTVRYVLPWMDRMDRWKDRKDREIEALRKKLRSQGRRITELEDIIQTLKAA